MTTSTLLTKAQWAELHGVSTKTVDRWLAAGQIPDAVRQAGRWFFPEGTPRPQGDVSHGGTSQDVPLVSRPRRRRAQGTRRRPTPRPP